MDSRPQAQNDAPNPAQGGPVSFSPVATALERLRTKARRRLVAQKLAGIAGFAALAVFFLALADYFVRLPEPVRIGHWVVGVAVLAWAFRKFVLPAARFRPSLTDVALRIEASEEGVRRGLSGWLASALELSQSQQPTAQAQTLSQSVVTEATRRFQGLDPAILLRHSAAAQRGMLLLVLALLPVLGAAGFEPNLSRIGVLRTLWPFANTAWPKRSAVLDATQIVAHPTTAALPMRAALLRGPGGFGADEDVTLHYRVLVEGQPARSGEALLTPQARTIEVGDASVGGALQGELYERLIEPAGLLGAGGDVQQGQLEYWFSTRDDATTPNHILLLQPPRIVAAQAIVTLPSYAATTPGTLTHGAQPLTVRAGEGDAIGPVLAGSRVRLDLTLSRPVPVPSSSLDLGSQEARAFVTAVFAGAVPSPSIASFNGTNWSIEWTSNESTRLVISPIDEHAIRAADDLVIRVNTVADRPPTVAVIEPARDEDVLASAVIDAATEAKDDVALDWTSLARQIRRAPGDSAGAPAEASGPEEEIARVNLSQVEPSQAAPGTRPDLARTETTMDFGPLALKPGDEVWLTGIAADRLGFDAAGAKREPTRSIPRKLRIISEAKLAEQVRAELQTLRQAAIRLEGEQAEINKQTQALQALPANDSKREQKAGELTQAQRGVRERTEPQRALVRQLADRIDRNAMSDADLRQTLAQAAETLNAAEAAAKQAADDLAAAQNATKAQDEPSAQQQFDQAQQQQREVRDELSKLIERLDRGQDGWATRQSVQRLLDEQQRLSQQTREAGQRNAGQEVAKLDAQQKAELEQIAARQEDLARKAADALDAMSKRGDQLQKSDPGQASALTRAQEEARQQQLQDTMRRAGEQAKRNQTGEANQLQQQAEKTLQQMLKQLDDADKRRDEALQRMLVQLADSIARLVTEQRVQITALAAAEKGERPFTALSEAMVALTQNTGALADSISENQQMRTVEELLTAAAESQSAAIVALRASPVDTFEADAAERASLQKLLDAQAEAKKKAEQADQRENDRKREELAQAYRDALVTQTALKTDADGFVGKEISRRDRATLRAISEKQEALRGVMSQLRDKTDELKEAKMFAYAHTRYDRVAESAAKGLGEPRADAAVQRDLASAVGVLRSLAASLEEAKKNKDFRDGAGGQQPGGQGQGQGQQPPMLPPLTELRLLRMMQDDAVARTRDASASGADEVLRDAATLQRDLSDQGTLLLQKLRDLQGGGASPGTSPPSPSPDPSREPSPKWHLSKFVPTTATHSSFAMQIAEPETPAPNAPSTSNPTTTRDPIPSLDELLGIPPETAPRTPSQTPAQSPAQTPADQGDDSKPRIDDALERALSPAESKELFEETVDLMSRTATRLERDQDAGAQTQRQQEDILRKLDKLIDDAQKQQQQQQQSNSSSSRDPKPNESSQQQQQQQRQQSQRSRNSSENVSPPDRQDGAGKNAASGTASWGGLPPHVRDALMQGFSDSFSSMYKQMTEEYYKRLAEEKKP